MWQQRMLSVGFRSIGSQTPNLIIVDCISPLAPKEQFVEKFLQLVGENEAL